MALWYVQNIDSHIYNFNNETLLIFYDVLFLYFLILSLI